MLSVRTAALFAVAGLAMIPALGRAQDTPPTQPGQQAPITLPPITVSVGRGTALDKLDVSTTLLTREQIQALPEPASTRS